MNYYFSKILLCTFEEALERVDHALVKEQFGIVSEIDIQTKLKEKLGVDFRKYKILGACNPPYAYQALQKEDKIGTMLPCNFIVQETKDGRVEVAAVDPIASMMAVQNPELGEMAMEVQQKIKNVIDSL